jgi:hypothetical protein
MFVNHFKKAEQHRQMMEGTSGTTELYSQAATAQPSDIVTGAPMASSAVSLYPPRLLRQPICNDGIGTTYMEKEHDNQRLGISSGVPSQA